MYWGYKMSISMCDTLHNAVNNFTILKAVWYSFIHFKAVNEIKEKVPHGKYFLWCPSSREHILDLISRMHPCLSSFWNQEKI